MALPIVAASDGTRITITYEDTQPDRVQTVQVGVEEDAPIFENFSPGLGFATAITGDVEFSIQITDEPPINDPDPPLGGAGVDADPTDTTVGTIMFVITTDDPQGGVFSDPTDNNRRDFVVTADTVEELNGTFTVTLALNSANITIPAGGLENIIPTGFVTTVSWWVEVQDNAGNFAVTDADPDTDGNQAYTVVIDALSATVSDAFTGDWWDGEDGRIKGDRAGATPPTTGGSMTNSIRVTFSEAIAAGSVDSGGADFTVEGFTVIAARVFSGAPNSVFLTLGSDLTADATPQVSLVTTTVTDKAENLATTGDKTSKDGIGPTATATPSTNLSTEAVIITVTTDEDISARRPRLQLFTTADNAATDTELTPTAITPSADPDVNEWVFRFHGCRRTDLQRAGYRRGHLW